MDAETHLKALMSAARAGDSAAYSTLLTELGAILRAYYRRRLDAGHGDVEDLVQETLIAMHTRRATYDASQPFTPWVFAIARYKLVDHFRRSGRRNAIPIEDADATFGESEQEAAMARRDVEKLIRTLPESSGALVRAVKLDGVPVEEVAQRAGMSVSAVKVAVHRALRRLSSALNGEAG